MNDCVVCLGNTPSTLTPTCETAKDRSAEASRKNSLSPGCGEEVRESVIRFQLDETKCHQPPATVSITNEQETNLILVSPATDQSLKGEGFNQLGKLYFKVRLEIRWSGTFFFLSFRQQKDRIFLKNRHFSSLQARHFLHHFY